MNLFPSLSKEQSLYIHIPFCTTCCSYCAFYSEPKEQWVDYQQAYLDRLLKEIVAVENDVSSFDTIFIGGGNPGSLTADQLSALLSAAQRTRKSREVTIEMNPETFSEAFFPLFEQKLVTRLSIGIQSMDDSILTRLQRGATVQTNLNAIALAQRARERYGIDLSFDLMVALPGQSTAMARSDILQLLDLCDVEHLSLYCLTVEEGTVLARQVSESELSVMDEDQQMEMLFALWDTLHKHGFSHYEVSNFAKNDRRCNHNMHYWKLGNSIGLGSSAASTLMVNDSFYHMSQIQGLSEYAKNPLFSGYEKETLTEQQRLEEYVMMALRTDRGIDKTYVQETWNIHFDRQFGKAIASLDHMWYVDNKQFFVLTEHGFMVLDEIVLRIIRWIV